MSRRRMRSPRLRRGIRLPSAAAPVQGCSLDLYVCWPGLPVRTDYVARIVAIREERFAGNSTGEGVVRCEFHGSNVLIDGMREGALHPLVLHKPRALSEHLCDGRLLQRKDS